MPGTLAEPRGRAALPVAEERGGQPAPRKRHRVRGVVPGLVWVTPALAFYGYFVLVPIGRAVQYSLYDWNGIGVATFVGGDNYVRVFADPERLSSLAHAFTLIIFFSVIPVSLGLVLAVLTVSIKSARWTRALQAILFLPQIIPLAAAGIAWSWVYSSNGLLNQVLRGIGLGRLARPWLGDYSTALPAIGVIGSWVLTGLCTVLLSTALGKVDSTLYEAIRIDGGGWWHEFRHITLPGLRQEIAVLFTITMIAALSSFDIIYVTTQGGPGRSTMVPGVEVYRLAFTERAVGEASALGIVLLVMVLLCVLPVQLLARAEK